MRTVLLLLALAASAGAEEPIRLYAVQIAWQGGPTLTQQVPVVDKLPLFAGPFRTPHLRRFLEARKADTFAWNVRTQLVQLEWKLAEFEANTFDPLEDAENTSAINDLESFGVLINYKRPVLTLDVPMKLGKETPVVRVTIERLPDAIKVQ
jgi:hypothetical protein